MSPPQDNRPEWAILAAFGVAVAGAAVFAAAYVMGGQTQILGTALGVAFAGLATGLTVWARHLVQSGGFVEEHEGFASSEAETADVTDRITAVAHPHRRGLLGMLAFAIVSLGAAALFPLRSLLQPRGDYPVRQLSETVWGKRPFRLVDADERPVRLADVTSQTVLTVFPQGHRNSGDAPAFLVRLDPARFSAKPPAPDINGVVAYSLLCTHAGCPVSLYEQTTGKMLCPCHQSVFDLLAGGRPTAGPAARALPGLPIAVDAAGFLYATGDFTGPPGPGYWSRP
jgi:ubiquinol-cytochrome c reductase iron-sulfur subunit